ncbi:MAG: hypothetical protein Q9M28_08935, partial [Mariprofundaceae bacterium]|nr:hypothetical protein [Mariprofundaceae bacterium]
RNKRQIFYFDDFLGSNYFEAIENKKDSHVTKFIERIRNDKSKRFLLTSRTNIFYSGIHHSSIFANKNIKKDEFILKIDALNDLEKGKILYNHIWFNDLKKEFIDEIYRNKRYLNIIEHKNFNPRLIEFITNVGRINVDANEFSPFISNTLDNPKDIWEHCFNTQSNSFIRNLVLLIVFNGSKMTEGELRTSYDKLISIENLTNPTNTDKRFNSTVKLATQSFLNRHMTDDSVSYSLFHPSIADYIINEYCNDKSKLIALYRSLLSIESLRTLKDLTSNGAISKTSYTDILETLFSKNFDDKHSYNYLIFICHALSGDHTKEDQIAKILNLIISKPKAIDDLTPLICLLEDFGPKISNYCFLFKTFKVRLLRYDELRHVLEFTTRNKINCPKLSSELKKQVHDYLLKELHPFHVDTEDSLYTSTGYDGEEKTELNSDLLNARVSCLFEEELSDLLSDIPIDLGIDTTEMAEDLNLNFDAMFNHQMGYSSKSDDDHFSNLVHSPMVDDINDLFERT